jgi:poly(beta-D-mannuronate) lyase
MSIAKPGDEIMLANGIWKDAELLLNANGTQEAPIRISVQQKGKVIFSGNSCLRISGSYLEISGLLFTNGYTPTSEVISFREKNNIYANNCRLTDCAIDGFNNPERFATETWIGLYGKNNRVDHCSFIDKRSQGVTVTVFPVDEASQNNHHLIDHNYFGYRQNLGSNGGETMRLGTSTYSLTICGTIVEANYFDRCNGELEIISNKSCGNTFKDNTFWECAGTLTFRHGHDNLATGNSFFGNGKEYTGGIRIINERNKAINNYLYGLTGYRLRGALVVMNGVPNSPINRYNQVIEGEFLNNTFVDCDYIQLCAGKDEERSLPPVKSRIEGNIFYHTGKNELFTVYDDISGIAILNNFANKPTAAIPNGIEVLPMKVAKNPGELVLPEFSGSGKVGCNFRKPAATLENTGAAWYPKRETAPLFGTGKIIEVEPGLNTLFDALKSAGSGDMLQLSNGEYTSTKDLFVRCPVTIRSASPEDKPLLNTEKNNLFTLENNGALKLQGIRISGKKSPDMAGNGIIATSKYAMNRNFKLVVENCLIEDLDVNNSFDFLKISQHTFADSILLRNCRFSYISGNILELNRETEDLGIYNAEHVNLENCLFNQVQGTVLHLYRGGTDESTFGPNLLINHCTFIESGKGKRNKSGETITIHGVQLAQMTNSLFSNCAPIEIYLTNGEPINRITNNNIYPETPFKTNSKDFKPGQLTFEKCLFEEESWLLNKNSALRNKATDGKYLGLLKIYQ